MADAVLSWTEERVELLGKLWGEGLSASQIAAQLGGGVTRNAVIGKVHRLGLSGRAKTGQTQPARPGKPPPRPAVAPAPVVDLASRPRSVAAPVEGPAAVASVAVPAIAEPAPVNIPVSHRVSLQELRETMCRWPLGDPQNPDFGFCGGRTVTGLPYCASHCRVAYQPATERKRLRA